jgi:hypothetical protein
MLDRDRIDVMSMMYPPKRKAATDKVQPSMSISAQKEAFQQKANLRSSKKNDDGDADVDLSLSVVFGIILVLLVTGASIATAFISMQNNPRCQLLTASVLQKPATIETQNSLRTGTNSQPVEQKVASTSSSLLDAAYPPALCTAEQIIAVKKQLPAVSCYDQPFLQGCSITKLTRGCQSPDVMRQFFSSSNSLSDPAKDNQPFLALIVGWREDVAPLDALYVGSRRNPKYNVYDAWGSGGENCHRTLAAESNSPPARDARVLVVEWDDHRYERLQNVKTKLTMSDQELLLDKTSMESASADETLTAIVQSKLLSNLNSDQPIHLALLPGRALDYTILTRQMAGLLKSIRYLAFEYDWKGSWDSSNTKLSVVIKSLKQEGYICYWAGDSGADFGLWRITDCWQRYYDEKNWARIACVNTSHDDVKGLGQQMERKFVETIARN